MNRPDNFIHFSQIQTYLQCGKKHQYGYVDRLVSIGYVARMLFGSMGHARLADRWLGTTDHVEGCLEEAQSQVNTPEHLAEIEQIRADAILVADSVFVELTRRFEPCLINGEPQVEVPVVVKWGEMNVGGTPDLVAVEKATGAVWVLDYKFRSTFMKPETEDLNLQMMFYQSILRQMGVSTVGTKQIQIRPFLPKQPKLNKDGSMSKADIMTDWATYSAALLKAGLGLTDYLAMRDKLANHVFVDFDSLSALRSQHELETVWRTEIEPALADIATEARVRRSFGKACEMCSYRELCIEELKGGDTEYLIGTKYMTKDQKYKLPVIDFEE